jgi:hypothetical protein
VPYGDGSFLPRPFRFVSARPTRKVLLRLQGRLLTYLRKPAIWDDDQRLPSGGVERGVAVGLGVGEGVGDGLEAGVGVGVGVGVGAGVGEAEGL